MSGSSTLATCPGCKTSTALKGKAVTVALTCSKCGAYYICTGSSTDRYVFKHDEPPVLQPGMRGRIDGYMYEVFGYAVKRDTAYGFRWREYLIYNPYRGYCFLSEYNGHWNILWPIESDPRPHKSNSAFFHNESEFRLFQKGRAEVVYAKGEFFFDIVGTTTESLNYEYIAPPRLFTVEQNDDSVLWCEGEYITKKEVAAAFQIDVKKLPRESGIGYTQPVGDRFPLRELGILTGLFFIALLAMQFFFSSTAADKVLHSADYTRADLQEGKVFVTPSFTLDDGRANIEVYLFAPVSNDWFFGEFTLVNEQSGTEYNFTKEVQYYSGIDSDGAWSEGSRVAEALLSDIPSGTYHLNIYPEFSATNTQFTLQVRRDVPVWTNFWVAFAALLAFPLIIVGRSQWLERRRWEESDYSPYHQE